MTLSRSILVTTVVITILLVAACHRPSATYSPLISASNVTPIVNITTPSAPILNGDAFKLTLPLIEGESLVHGKAPPNAPILILDITSGGAILAQGKSDEKGIFKLKLETPLISGHRIGISIPPEFRERVKCSKCQDVPLIGLILDSALVQSKTSGE